MFAEKIVIITLLVIAILVGFLLDLLLIGNPVYFICSPKSWMCVTWWITTNRELSESCLHFQDFKSIYITAFNNYRSFLENTILSNVDSWKFKLVITNLSMSFPRYSLEVSAFGYNTDRERTPLTLRSDFVTDWDAGVPSQCFGYVTDYFPESDLDIYHVTFAGSGK